MDTQNHFHLLRVANVRDRMNAHYRDEISYSRAVELLNQDANEALALAVVSGSSSGRESEDIFYLESGHRARLALDHFKNPEPHEDQLRLSVEDWCTMTTDRGDGWEEDVEYGRGTILLSYGQAVALRNQLNKYINQVVADLVRKGNYR